MSAAPDFFIVERPESLERMPATVHRLLWEEPHLQRVVEQAACGAPPLRHHELNWVALIVDEVAQVAQSAALPRVLEAQLPELYVKACQAIEACAKLDECRDWQSKAAALASYARQVHDETLRDCAMRIQLRAAHRCGRLLLEIAGAQGRRTDRLQAGTGPKLLTRAEAATAAGLSERQRKDALRLAALPDAEFEAAVEAAPAPTLTALAALGTMPRPPTARGPTPAQVAWSTAALLRQIAVIADTNDTVHAAFASAGITSAMLRYHSEAIRAPERMVGDAA